MPKCGERHPDHPEVTCLSRGVHGHHQAPGVDPWPNQVVLDAAATKTAQRPKGKKSTQREIREIAAETIRGRQEMLDGQRKPIVRNDDPATAHEAAEAYEPKRDSAKGRVLAYLRYHQGQWVDAPLLTAPEVGGFAGTRRLRELRDAGHLIETRRKPGDTNTWQHRLVP